MKREKNTTNKTRPPPKKNPTTDQDQNLGIEANLLYLILFKLFRFVDENYCFFKNCIIYVKTVVFIPIKE